MRGWGLAKKLFKLFLKVSIPLLFLIAIFFVLVLYSGWGSRQILNIYSWASEDNIKYNHIDGGIAEGMVIKGLEIEGNDYTLSLSEGGFKINPWVALLGDIEVNLIAIDSLDIKIDNPDKKVEDKESSEPFDFQSIKDIDIKDFLNIKIEEVDIKDSQVVIGEQRYKISKALFSSSIENGIAQIDISNVNSVIAQDNVDGDIQEQGFNLSAKVDIDATGAPEGVPTLTGEIRWSTKISEKKFSGVASVNGNIGQLTIKHSLQKPWKVESILVAGITNDNMPYFDLITKSALINYVVDKDEIKIEDLVLQICNFAPDNNIINSNDNKRNGELKEKVLDQINITLSAKTGYINNSIEMDFAGYYLDGVLNINTLKILSDRFGEVHNKGKIRLDNDIVFEFEGDAKIKGVDDAISEFGLSNIDPLYKLSGNYNIQNFDGDIDLQINIPEAIHGTNKSGSNKAGIGKTSITDDENSAKDINIDLTSKISKEKVITKIVSIELFDASLSAEYKIEENAVDVEIKWNDFSYPLFMGEGENLISSFGSLSAIGKPDDISLFLESEISHQGISTKVAAKAKNTNSKLFIEGFDIENEIGKLAAKGKVDYEKQPKIIFEISGRDLNGESLGIKRSDIDFDSLVEASVNNGNIEVGVDITSINGSIDSKSIKGKGVVDYQFVDTQKYNGYFGSVDSMFNLVSGNAVVNILGKVYSSAKKPVVDGSYVINIPEIGDFISGVEGTIKSEGKVSGGVDNIVINGSSLIEKLVYQENTIGSGHINNKIKIKDNVPFFDIKADFVDLKLEDNFIKQSTLAFSGNMEKHQLQLNADGDIDLSISLNGGFDDNRWLGELERGEIENKFVGKLIMEPVAISFGNSILSIDESCVLSSGDKICYKAKLSEAKSEINLDIINLSFDRFSLQIPEGIELKGGLNGNIDIKINESDLLKAELISEINSSSGFITTYVDNEKVSIPFEMGMSINGVNGDYYISSQAVISDNTTSNNPNINGVSEKSNENSIGNKRVNSRANSRSRLNAKLNANILLTETVESIMESKIDSKLNLSTSYFDWVDEFVPDIDGVKGDVVVDISTNGSIGNPRFSGNATFSEGRFTLIPVGITVSNINIGGSFIDKSLLINGTAKSGKGDIAINAKIDSENTYPINVYVKGDRFEALDIEDLYVSVSPLLKIKIEEDNIDIAGDVLIDKAQIRVNELPESAVSESRDVTIINGDNSVADQKNAKEINTNINLIMGDDIKFKGFGLMAGVSGKINYKQKDGFTEAFGELNILDGKFKKFGARLDIENGQVIFAGPVANPGINIKAARKLNGASGEQKVSVLITGTVKDPVITFPEASAYGQTDAISNIVTGKPASQVGKSDSEEGNNEVLYSVGMSAGGKYKEKVQDELGLDALEITAAGWMLGKYLTPDLYISYTMGWLENDRAVKLRYSLGKLWSVELNSGQEQAVDILYSIEKPD